MNLFVCASHDILNDIPMFSPGNGPWRSKAAEAAT